MAPARVRGAADRRVALRRTAALVTAGVMSLAAVGGGLGLIAGFLGVPDLLVARLPFRSPVLGGLALLVVVALPTGCAAVLAARRHPRYADVSALAGVALVGWIAVEAAVVRMFSPLQVVCGLAGVLLVLLGDPRGRRS